MLGLVPRKPRILNYEGQALYSLLKGQGYIPLRPCNNISVLVTDELPLTIFYKVKSVEISVMIVYY